MSIHLSHMSQKFSFGLSSLDDFFFVCPKKWVTICHFDFHSWQSCLSNLTLFRCPFRKPFLLPVLFLRTLCKVHMPGLIEKHVAASGYPMPVVLFVLKKLSSEMVIDMKPGGSTGLTTCSINTFLKGVSQRG